MDDKKVIDVIDAEIAREVHSNQVELIDMEQNGGGSDC